MGESEKREYEYMVFDFAARADTRQKPGSAAGRRGGLAPWGLAWPSRHPGRSLGTTPKALTPNQQKPSRAAPSLHRGR